MKEKSSGARSSRSSSSRQDVVLLELTRWETLKIFQVLSLLAVGCHLKEKGEKTLNEFVGTLGTALSAVDPKNSTKKLKK